MHTEVHVHGAIPLKAGVTQAEVEAYYKGIVDPNDETPISYGLNTRVVKKDGKVVEYQIGITATANLFRRGHRICLDISCVDMPTGIGGATNAEYIPNHIGSAKTTVAKIFHDTKRPSHLLLPVRPRG